MEKNVVVGTAGVGDERDLLHHGEPGSPLVRVRSSGAVEIEVGGEVLLCIARRGDSVTIDLGAGAEERLVLGDSFRGFLNEFIAERFDAHVHAVQGKVTTPPQPQFTGAQMPEEHLSRTVRGR